MVGMSKAPYPVFDLLTELGLDKPEARLERLVALPQSAWKEVASTLDAWHGDEQPKLDEPGYAPRLSDVWIPFPDLELASHVSDRLLVSENVVFNDIFSDLVSRVMNLADEGPKPQDSMAAEAIRRYDPDLAWALKEAPTVHIDEHREAGKVLCRIIHEY